MCYDGKRRNFHYSEQISKKRKNFHYTENSVPRRKASAEQKRGVSGANKSPVGGGILGETISPPHHLITDRSRLICQIEPSSFGREILQRFCGLVEAA